MTKKMFLEGIKFKYDNNVYSYDVLNNALIFNDISDSGYFACSVISVWSYGCTIDQLHNFQNIVLKFAELQVVP